MVRSIGVSGFNVASSFAHTLTPVRLPFDYPLLLDRERATLSLSLLYLSFGSRLSPGITNVRENSKYIFVPQGKRIILRSLCVREEGWGAGIIAIYELFESAKSKKGIASGSGRVARNEF